jgi:hypothetical protein
MWYPSTPRRLARLLTFAGLLVPGSLAAQLSLSPVEARVSERVEGT